MSAGNPLPPLVLRCRPIWRVAYGGAALVLIGLGTAGAARHSFPEPGGWIEALAPAVLLLFGGGCAYFSARYCFARLILDERGFRLVGPFGRSEIPWASVVRWERRRLRGGPVTLRVVFGPAQRRLAIPMIYEDGEVLEIGLGQGRFPRY